MKQLGMIIQHAISLPVFMKSCLTLMKKEKKEVNPIHIAYLEDRMRIFSTINHNFTERNLIGTKIGNNLNPVFSMIQLRKSK